MTLFVLLYDTNFMNKFKFNDFFKLKTKNNSLTAKYFFQSTKSPHSQRKGWSTLQELCWSLYVISLWLWSMHGFKPLNQLSSYLLIASQFGTVAKCFQAQPLHTAQLYLQQIFKNILFSSLEFALSLLLCTKADSVNSFSGP